MSPSEFEAHKARRRARFFAARHVSKPPPQLDPERLAFERRVSRYDNPPTVVEEFYRLLPVILTLFMVFVAFAVLVAVVAGGR